MSGGAPSLPEEILLLLLDDATGRPVGLPGPAAALALAGAILMELALAGRVDTDPERLVVADAALTGDAVLDAALAQLVADTRTAPDSAARIAALARATRPWRTALLERLVVRGVLRAERDRFLWVFAEHRYPKAPDGREMPAVRERLRAVLLGADIPDPRDALLVSLVRAAGLLPRILSTAEAAAAAPRLATVARLEELGRAVAAAVTQALEGRLALDEAP